MTWDVYPDDCWVDPQIARQLWTYVVPIRMIVLFISFRSVWIAGEHLTKREGFLFIFFLLCRTDDDFGSVRRKEIEKGGCLSAFLGHHCPSVVSSAKGCCPIAVPFMNATLPSCQLSECCPVPRGRPVTHVRGGGGNEKSGKKFTEEESYTSYFCCHLLVIWSLNIVWLLGESIFYRNNCSRIEGFTCGLDGVPTLEPWVSHGDRGSLHSELMPCCLHSGDLVSRAPGCMYVSSLKLSCLINLSLAIFFLPENS